MENRKTASERKQTGKRIKKTVFSGRRKKYAAYVLLLLILTVLAVFAVVYNSIPANRRTTINGITLRGELTEELIMSEKTYYYIAPGSVFTFDMKMKYTDSDGKSAYSDPLDKSVITMIFSDTSVCDRLAYNQIVVHPEVEAATTFTVKTIYNKNEVTYTFFVAINTADTVDENGFITNPENITAYVGRNRMVPYDYAPNLITPGIKFVSDVSEENKQLRREASIAAERLFTAAKNAGYVLIAEYCYSPGSEYGYEHMLGLAIDITCGTAYYNGKTFSSTSEYRWLERNAYKYGFVLRYEEDKTSVTGYGYDPSHFRYVGTTLAEYLYTNGLSLDEVTIEALEGF